jgi:antirestriction protein
MTHATQSPSAKVEDEAALYCGTYAKYNNGSIKGAWMKLSDYADADEFFAACKELHKDESDPELMFQDFECFPKTLYSESMSMEDAEKLYEYVNIPEADRDMVAAYLDNVGGEFTADMLSEAEDAYSGQYDSDEDFAQQLAEDIGAVTEGLTWPNNCIDWKHAARELMYDYFESDGYYFRNC